MTGDKAAETLVRLRRRMERKRLDRTVNILDNRDHEGRLVNFELDKTSLGREDVCAILSTIPGIRITSLDRRPRFDSWIREEEFCEFELDGVVFAASESCGDDDRYCIGPVAPTGPIPQIERVHQAFASKTTYPESLREQ